MSRPFDFERLLSLRQPAFRDRDNLYLAEGLRAVLAALDTQATMAALFVAPDLLRHPVGQAVVRRSRRRGLPIISLQPQEYAQLCDAPDPAGIGAVLSQRWLTPDQALAARPDCWLAVEEIRSPGNLGTMIRTCEAANVPGIIVLGRPDAADPYHPGAVRASMGAVVTRSFVRLTGPEFLEWTRRGGYRVFGTDPAGARDYRTVSYRQPVVLVLGNERRGLSSEQAAVCDLNVRIPLSGRTDSLNVAVATGVLLFEVQNQRRPVPRTMAKAVYRPRRSRRAGAPRPAREGHLPD